MFRHIVRTNLCLARRKIINFTPVVCRTISCSDLVLNLDQHRNYCVKKPDIIQQQTEFVDPVVYEEICSETLESLCDYFEELVESSPLFKGADIIYSDGVLTVDLGKQFGTYVINRQTPNKQIWLSSPTSGPKRYDLVLKNGGYWIYKHDGVSLHQLLQEEISKIANFKVDFNKCQHSLV